MADIAQESFARLAAVDDLAAIEDPRAFLYRVAANLAADAHDHQQVRARYSEPDIDPDTLPSSSPGPPLTATGGWSESGVRFLDSRISIVLLSS